MNAHAVQFRLGPALHWARVLQDANGLYTVESRGGSFCVPHGLVSRVVAGPAATPLLEGLATPPDLSGAFQEAVSEHLLRGSIKLREGRLTSFDRRGRGLCVEGRKRPLWLAPETVLETHPEIGEHLALEWARPYLVRKGIVESGKAVRASYGALTDSLYVYMKRCPFRDVTKLYEGTVCEASGYDRGCAMLVADGERFWLPVESSTFSEAIPKDEDYYQTLDANGNNLPDPLEYLPGKVGLRAGTPAQVGPDSNFNAAPDLRLVAGNFASLPDIANDEGDILGESYGVLRQYYDDAIAAGFYDYDEGEDEVDLVDYFANDEDCPIDVEAVTEQVIRGGDLDSLFARKLRGLKKALTVRLLGNPLVTTKEML